MINAVRLSVSLSLAALSVAAPGCGSLLQGNRVERQFHANYDCESAFTQAEPGGYSVAGCGIVAHYRCLTGHHQGLFDQNPSECFLAQTDEGSHKVQLPPADPVSTHRDSRLGVVVRGHADLLAGAQLTVLGAPSREPKRVVLELHGRDRVVAGECKARLYRDGDLLPVLNADAIGPYDVRFTVDVAGLDAAQTATRIAGDGCGVTFELDAAGRQMLGLFAARFREERSKGAAPQP